MSSGDAAVRLPPVSEFKARIRVVVQTASIERE